MNPLYVNEYAHTLDGQRRLAIPSAWRNSEGGDEWFAVQGSKGLLQLIPAVEFNTFIDKVRKVALTNRDLQVRLARFAAGIQSCKLDKNGRIQLETRMVEHAGITTEAVLVGAFTTIQIWEPKRWAAEKELGDDDLLAMQEINDHNDPWGALVQALQGEVKK